MRSRAWHRVAVGGELRSASGGGGASDASKPALRLLLLPLREMGGELHEPSTLARTAEHVTALQLELRLLKRLVSEVCVAHSLGRARHESSPRHRRGRVAWASGRGVRAPEIDRLTAPLAWEVLLRSGVMNLLLALLAAGCCRLRPLEASVFAEMEPTGRGADSAGREVRTSSSATAQKYPSTRGTAGGRVALALPEQRHGAAHNNAVFARRRVQYLSCTTSAGRAFAVWANSARV